MVPHQLTDWFRSQFLQPHRRRDEDVEFWWQLPIDRTRTASPWTQLVVDLVAPAAFSEWHEQVAESRVKVYDRIRPPVTRALLLGLIVAGMWALYAPWWCWAMLSAALVQVLLEIYQTPYLFDSAYEPRWAWARRVRDLTNAHFQTMLLNVTGVLGIVACPLNVLAVCLAPGSQSYGWVKIAALAAAIFYANSGLASALLDPPNYTENSVMPPVMHWIRPYAPLISYGVVTAMVSIGAALGRWPGDLVPVAYLCATLTLLLGSTLRNHDRMIAAAALVARKAVQAGRSELGGVVHDDLGPAKAAAEAASRAECVSYQDAVELQTLAAYLTHFSARVGVYAAQRMELSYLVEKLIGPYGISRRDVSYDIRWPARQMRKHDHRVAIRMTAALIHNVGQTLRRPEYRDIPKSIVLEGYSTGAGRDVCYHLAVHDHLPVIGSTDWCAPGSTLAALRSWLRADFNGDLTQQESSDGTKKIIASWADRPPINEYVGDAARKQPR
jgi:hypothetical protein